jgi:dTDP-4-dehydrorhamnose 3,5-epimerase
MPSIRNLGFDGVVEILPDKFGDDRGFFSETFNKQALTDVGIDLEFVQDNHSYSAEIGVLRGLHFQKPPFAQDKLVRVTRGKVFDVVVDIRQGSPTFAQWISVEISAEKWNQILVPKGFAHGFVTLEPNTEFLYKVTDYYSKECDGSIHFKDPDIAINWPIDLPQVIVSDKDRDSGRLIDMDTGFKFEG